MCKIKYLSFTLKSLLLNFYWLGEKDRSKNHSIGLLLERARVALKIKRRVRKKREKIKNKRGRRYCQLTACTTEV